MQMYSAKRVSCALSARPYFLMRLWNITDRELREITHRNHHKAQVVLPVSVKELREQKFEFVPQTPTAWDTKLYKQVRRRVASTHSLVKKIKKLPLKMTTG